jgi:Uncharacterized protein conserved in bacteria (DUF2066)
MALSRRLVALILLGVGAWWPASAPRAQAAGDVFQVSAIPVDATAVDAVTAREEALRQGQIEGFRRLLRRLVPAEHYGRLPALGPGEIERYVQNFEIADEQVASDQYIARLTVRYAPDAVRELLQARGLPYAEVASMPVVILPLYQTASGPKLWPEDNPWWQAWAEHLDSERLLRLVLPLGDLGDMATVSPDRAMAGDTDALSALAARYAADDVLLVIATPREAAPPALELEVRRNGIEAANPPETLVARPEETLEDLMAEAVTGLQDSLDERWKSANLLRYDQARSMVVDIPIARLSDWVEISRGLQGLPEVDRVEVAAFARDKVRARVRYLGDELRLEEALGRLGLALSREGESWLLLPTGASPSQGEPASARSTSF